MSEEIVQSPPGLMSVAATVETEFTKRVGSGFKTAGFDPGIFLPMLMDFLMGLFTDCGGEDPDITPEQAISRVKKLGAFQQSYIFAKWERKLKSAGVKKYETAASKTFGVVKNVAQSSTPEEQLAFAQSMVGIVVDPFVMG